MSEWLNLANETTIPSPKCTPEACDRTDSHLKKTSNPEEITVIPADISHHRAHGPGPSEREVQHVPDKGGIVIQYIHFSVGKNGCLE
jgi:hypothetical protein